VLSASLLSKLGIFGAHGGMDPGVIWIIFWSITVRDLKSSATAGLQLCIYSVPLPRRGLCINQ
jgi:hypothetical protein